jgi:hypothetical protein
MLKQGLTSYGIDSGAANAYVVTMPFTQTAYTDGLEVSFKASATNTGASTVNVDGLGAKAIVRRDGTALSASDILVGKIIAVRYNSTSDSFEFQDVVTGDMTTITTVAGIASEVVTVAGIASDVVAVDANATNINTVAGISSNVTTVAGISADVTTVAGISSDVAAVAADSADIGAVAGISSDVAVVAAAASAVSICATNIAAIQTAPTYASNASISAVAAEAAQTAAETAQGLAETAQDDAASNAATATAAKTASETARDESVAAWTAALAANPDLDPAVRMNPSTIQTDTTIPSGYNAYSAGPFLTIGEGVTVTINDNANWSII